MAPVPPRIVIVAAMGRNRVIGRAGGLPWRMPSDLRTFRRITMGKPVIMGRTTFQSIGKPLDGRMTIVVSRNAALEPDGVTIAGSLEAALDLARAEAERLGCDEIVVAGGAMIYAEALPLADRLYLTVIAASPDGDAAFPLLDERDWREIAREALPRTDRDEHSAVLMVYDRVEPHQGRIQAVRQGRA